MQLNVKTVRRAGADDAGVAESPLRGSRLKAWREQSERWSREGRQVAMRRMPAVAAVEGWTALNAAIHGAGGQPRDAATGPRSWTSLGAGVAAPAGDARASTGPVRPGQAWGGGSERSRQASGDGAECGRTGSRCRLLGYTLQLLTKPVTERVSNVYEAATADLERLERQATRGRYPRLVAFRGMQARAARTLGPFRHRAGPTDPTRCAEASDSSGSLRAKPLRHERLSPPRRPRRAPRASAGRGRRGSCTTSAPGSA